MNHEDYFHDDYFASTHRAVRLFVEEHGVPKTFDNVGVLVSMVIQQMKHDGIWSQDAEDRLRTLFP